jgi:hypothetical protein
MKTPEPDLERLVDRELRRLPTPRAPQTLLPRVMHAVQAQAHRPWYTRAWVTWPIGWQIVSVAALAAIVAGGAVLLPHARTAVATIAAAFASDDVTAVSQQVAETTSGAGILWRTLLSPLLSYVFGIVVLMVLACVAFGTALNYVVIEKAAHR